MKKLYLQSADLLTTLQEKEFEQEVVLQNLLEKHPELIPSDEIIGNPSFLMVQKELPVSTGFIDLFLIDNLMVPIIIETKVNNPEIRRKIIGQGFEYLTSLYQELTGKQIIEYAKSYWGVNLPTQVKSKLNIDDLNEKEIDKNLKKPRMRLLFIADFIPKELRDYVKFANTTSRGIDIYAIQIERFLIEEKIIYSVTTYGPTENIIHDKSLSYGLLTQDEYINKINKSEELTKEEKRVGIERINQILDLAEEQNLSIAWAQKSFRIEYQYIGFKRRLEFYYYGKVNVDYIPQENRDTFINDLYKLLDQVFDLKKSYLSKDSQFKQGLRTVFKLNDQQYSYLLEAIKKLPKSNG